MNLMERSIQTFFSRNTSHRLLSLLGDEVSLINFRLTALTLTRLIRNVSSEIESVLLAKVITRVKIEFIRHIPVNENNFNTQTPRNIT